MYVCMHEFIYKWFCRYSCTSKFAECSFQTLQGHSCWLEPLWRCVCWSSIRNAAVPVGLPRLPAGSWCCVVGVNHIRLPLQWNFEFSRKMSEFSDYGNKTTKKCLKKKNVNWWTMDAWHPIAICNLWWIYHQRWSMHNLETPGGTNNITQTNPYYQRHWIFFQLTFFSGL